MYDEWDLKSQKEKEWTQLPFYVRYDREPLGALKIVTPLITLFAFMKTRARKSEMPTIVPVTEKRPSQPAKKRFKFS